MLQTFGLVVHLAPVHAEHLHQELFDQPVAPQHQRGQLLAGRRQPHAHVRLVADQPRLRQRLHHRRRGSRDDAERRGELAHRARAPSDPRRAPAPDRSPSGSSRRSATRALSSSCEGQSSRVLHDIRRSERPRLRDALRHAGRQAPLRQRGCSRTIADRYDLITVLLSYGRIGAGSIGSCRWRRSRRASAALDLACGTGDITYALHARGARVVGLDITPRMIELARDQSGGGCAAVASSSAT